MARAWTEMLLASETLPIVFHRQAHGFGRGLQRDFNIVRAGMFHGVRNRLAGDPQKIIFNLGGQRPNALIQAEFQPDVFGLGDFARRIGDCGG